MAPGLPCDTMERPTRLGHVVDAVEIYLDRVVPQRVGHIENGGGGCLARNAGIVYKPGQLPQHRLDFGDAGGDLLAIAHIAFHRHRFSAHATYFLGNRLDAMPAFGTFGIGKSVGSAMASGDGYVRTLFGQS